MKIFIKFSSSKKCLQNFTVSVISFFMSTSYKFIQPIKVQLVLHLISFLKDFQKIFLKWTVPLELYNSESIVFQVHYLSNIFPNKIVTCIPAYIFRAVEKFSFQVEYLHNSNIWNPSLLVCNSYLTFNQSNSGSLKTHWLRSNHWKMFEKFFSRSWYLQNSTICKPNNLQLVI